MLPEAGAAGRRFDLVLLDFLMPGMNGGEVAEAIRGDEPIADQGFCDDCTTLPGSFDRSLRPP
jgi:CheY-like chemotaxis protein